MSLSSAWPRSAAVVLVAIIVALIVGPSPTAAQAPPPGSESLTVSPPMIELDAPPGATIKQKVSIDNKSAEERSIAVIIQNVNTVGEFGQSEPTDEEDSYAMAQWIKVAPETATIGPEGRKEFDVEINVPQNAPPGGHFGILVFEPTGGGDGGSNVKVVSRVTTLILLKVPGDANERLDIESFTAAKSGAKTDEKGLPKPSKLFQRGPVDFNLRIQNQGNVHVKPTAEITIRNIFGKKVATLNAEPRNVLPDSIRRYDVSWDRGNLFGLYKAEAVVNYGTGETQTLKSSLSFWGAPAGTLAAILLGALALFLLLWLPRKRLKNALKALKNG